MRVLVTGGAGFIGSALVLDLVLNRGAEVLTFDGLTYAANPASLAALSRHPAHRLVRGDVADASAIREAIAGFRPEAIVHLAAETHVDRSIDAPAAFVRTNLVGTATLLDAALAYWRGLPPAVRDAFRLLHVSTDEVFGSIAEGRFTESSPMAPRSPYAASKAGADHLVRAWSATYGLPVLIAHPSNAYGPRQFPEKLIPLAILNALEGRPVAVYGDGLHEREWLHVEDLVAGLVAVLERGRPGESYLLAGAESRPTIAVARAVCAALDRLRPAGRPRHGLIAAVADRPGHDRRYASDGAKAARDLGWRPDIGWDDGLAATIRWYLDNEPWWRPIRGSAYRGERLGLAPAS